MVLSFNESTTANGGPKRYWTTLIRYLQILCMHINPFINHSRNMQELVILNLQSCLKMHVFFPFILSLI